MTNQDDGAGKLDIWISYKLAKRELADAKNWLFLIEYSAFFAGGKKKTTYSKAEKWYPRGRPVASAKPLEKWIR